MAVLDRTKEPGAPGEPLLADVALTLLEAVGAIVAERKVHAVGYCLGGTLLAIHGTRR